MSDDSAYRHRRGMSEPLPPQTHSVQYGPPGRYFVRQDDTREAVFQSDSKSETVAEAERRNGWPITGDEAAYTQSRTAASRKAARPTPHGSRTAPGVMHAQMHPLTKARVDAYADLGRRQAALDRAWYLHGKGEVSEVYVERKQAEHKQALQCLIEAAQAEGAGE